MRVLSGLKRASIAAICISVVVGCSDDDKGKGMPDGSQNEPDRDGGPNSTLDGGLDATLIRHDATVLPDGKVIDETPPSDGGPALGPDGGDASAPLPCGGSCDDHVDCTIDSCIDDKCQHRVDNDFCAAGSSCSVTAGCQQGKTCSSNADCADMDGCTTSARCNTMLARCEYNVLDRDGDGYPPASCGGTDCDDDNGLISPSAPETCDGVDDDCNGQIDDGLNLPQGEVCTMGSLRCAEGYTRCAGACVDTKTDPTSCGGCGLQFNCGSGGVCTGGVCSCPPSENVMMCGGMYAGCANLSKSELNCGTCGTSCAPTGQQVMACINGACTGCGGENQVCCDNGGIDFISGCADGLTCEGTPGTAGSKCTCGAGSTKCGNACVDLKADDQNCGACGTACQPGEVCTTEGETTSCKECGRVGERCCASALPFGGCIGSVCGPDDTCVTVSNGGGNGPG
jgi:hypothetical protein